MMIIGGGMDPAEMMVGMAIGGVVGKQMADTMNNSMNNMQQNARLANPPPAPPAPPQQAGHPSAIPPAPVAQAQNSQEIKYYDERTFYSTDRLLKFGMSTNVAQQMVDSMNHAVRNMTIPGAGNPLMQPQRPQPVVVLEVFYYAMIDGKQSGPYCETELARLINDGKVSRETLVWHTGLDEWKTAENIPAILRLVAIAPPPPPPPNLS